MWLFTGDIRVFFILGEGMWRKDGGFGRLVLSGHTVIES
jgi:hypothetical protein